MINAPTPSSSSSSNEEIPHIPTIVKEMIHAATQRDRDTFLLFYNSESYKLLSKRIINNRPDILLAKSNDIEACKFIVELGVLSRNSIILYAAYFGHQALSEFFLNQKRFEAARDGFEALAKYFENVSNEYNNVASFAAEGGHQLIAAHFLMHAYNKKPNFDLVARRAKEVGHHDLAEHIHQLKNSRLGLTIAKSAAPVTPSFSEERKRNVRAVASTPDMSTIPMSKGFLIKEDEYQKMKDSHRMKVKLTALQLDISTFQQLIQMHGIDPADDKRQFIIQKVSTLQAKLIVVQQELSQYLEKAAHPESQSSSSQSVPAKIPRLG